MSSSAIHIGVPPSLQRFTCFSSFPFDIRHQIWEEIIYTPGIHFLKFEHNDDTIMDDSDSATDDGDSIMDRLPVSEAEPGRDAKRAKFSSTLKPVFPFPAADKSYYLTMNKTFTQLSLACNEAKDLVDNLISRSGNLTLDNGRLVLLERSSDIVCFDYPGASWSRSLGYWADHLDLDQLAKIRRVAVRYSSKWDEECRVCRTCGIIHNFHRNHDNTRPRHAYEFAALFKNLETFYFMDCLAVRKQRDKSMPTSCVYAKQAFGNKGEHFASGEGGRTYYEVDPQCCKINTHVFRTLDWVRDNYVTHCQKRHRGRADPEKVKFKVLTCEWDAEELVPPKRQETKSTRVSNKGHRTRITSVTEDLKKLKLNDTQNRDTRMYEGLPVVFGDGGKSKFEFTIEVPHSLST
ncbi:uncharacterized protein GGS22DRAFT_179707 [Annulohypoxylon maeteangense]|uniref:uncharacterized protein n=1 Tax=Annulohypoxylon maeteangense TaxID=1927788 RepID=UPI002008E920|nr:uncharacterized protein GGS22DRAFT_179707 [Annulohypoxylon maeteangense]KAI0885096.1 hypothetical protein GGS22DRAFT_179707 [Annulohypoxylon maeteangense]